MMTRTTHLNRDAHIPLVVLLALSAPATPAFGQLDANCTVTVNGQTATVNPDGSFSIGNVAVGPGLWKVTATCNLPGLTLYGISDEFFTVANGQTVQIANLALSPFRPALPLGVMAAPDDPTLTALGQTTQVRVMAELSDGTPADVTLRSEGTTYTSSNSAIASIDENGLVTANASGVVLITATNMGATTVTGVAVSLGDLLTTVEGFVQLSDGTPVENAEVRVLSQAAAAFTDPFGHYSISDVATLFGPIIVVAEITIGEETLKAITTGLTPVPGGLTDAGILQLGGNIVLWANNAGGTWSAAGNWHTGSVPQAPDSAVIALGGSYTVTLDTSPTIAGFTLDAPDATFFAQFRTLTVDGPSTLTRGSVVWHSSMWAGTGTVTNRATMVFEGIATMSGPFQQMGEVLVQGQNFGFNALLTVNGGLINRGTITLESRELAWNSSLTVNGGPLVNEALGVLNVNEGSGGNRVITAELDNRGTVDVNTSATLSRSDAAHSNSGSINISAGTLTLTQSGAGAALTNTGTIDIAPQTTLKVSGGTFDHEPGATLAVGGVLEMSDVTLNYNGTTTGDPTLVLTNTSLNIGAGAADPLTFAMHGPNSTLTGQIAEQQTLLVQGRSSAGGSALLTVSGGLINRGTITLESRETSFASSDLTVNGGPLVNEALGVLNVNEGSGGSRVITAELDNRGTVDVNTSATLSRSDAAHSNSGSINVSAGTLTLTQSGAGAALTNTGTIDIAPQATLKVSGGAFNHEAGATLAVEGVLEMRDATLNYNGTITGDPTLALRDTSLNIGAGAADPLTFAMHGTSNLTGQIAEQQTLLVQGQSFGFNALLTVNGGLINRGTITLESRELAWNSSLTVNGGPLVNEALGVLNVNEGSGGRRVITAELDNRGEFNVDADLRINRAEVDHSNVGNMIVTSDATITITGAGSSFTNAVGGLVTGVGTLNVTAITFVNESLIDPGIGAGVLNITGDYMQTGSGEMNIELGGLIPGDEYDVLNVSGTATLDGTIDVALLPGFEPVLGDEFEVVTFGSRVGDFATYNGLKLGMGLVLEPTFGASSLTLRVIPGGP